VPWNILLVDGLILLAAIVFIIATIVLRSVLSITFPFYRIRRLSDTFRPPVSVADLYERVENEMRALGFSRPRWMLMTPQNPASGEMQTIVAVFIHRQQASLALVFPPLLATAPNAQVTRFVTRLADGRLLSSQTCDAYAETVADGKYLLAQTLGDGTLSQQWRQHLNWRGQFACAAATEGIEDNRLTESLEFILSDRDRLLKSGKLWLDKRGTARPKLFFALAALRLFLSRPRHKANGDEVPVARAVMLAAITEKLQQRSLPLRWQWSLFVLSCLLFALFGGLLFDFSFALILLAVIVLHEGGHYLAMLALGYKNVQMLALPLAGGITLGTEDKPTAARRAWMAMMGPLPGILLGWALTIFMWTSPLSAEAPEWLGIGIFLLLLVNYVNLLPILPLDGGHILQAMLPPRWFGVRIAILMTGCLIAAAAAWFFNLYLIAFLVFLQIPFMLSSLTVQRRTIRLLESDTAFSQANHQAKTRITLEALGRLYRDKTKTLNLLGQARQIVEIYTQEPMNAVQRSLLAATYVSLLSLPLFIAFFWFVWFGSAFFGTDEELAAQQAQYAQRFERQKEIARTYSVPQLLSDLAGDEIMTPASRNALAQTELRLRKTLPEELKMLYANADGMESIGLAPQSQLQWASVSPGWRKVMENIEEEQVEYENDGDSLYFTLDMPGWLYAGTVEEGFHAYLYNPDPATPAGGHWLECWLSSCTGRASIRAWLEDQWIAETAFEED